MRWIFPLNAPPALTLAFSATVHRRDGSIGERSGEADGRNEYHITPRPQRHYTEGTAENKLHASVEEIG